MSAIEILSWPFKQDSINQINNSEQYLNYPVIYVLNGNKEAYIGETVYFKNRMKDHLKARKNIDQINLIKHEQFNRSATFHLETKLINYFLGDEKYTLQNKSKTASDFTHNYYTSHTTISNYLKNFGKNYMSKSLSTMSYIQLKTKTFLSYLI